MISFKKIIKSWVIVSLACNSLAAAELVDESITTTSGIVEPMFGDEDGGSDGLLCHIPPTVENFDLTAFANGPWFVQEATPTAFLSASDTCVEANYDLLSTPTEQGWTISVQNSSKNKKGKDVEAELCGLPFAKANGDGTLQVAQCSLPPSLIKPNYFVLAYKSVVPSYALVVSGTQPPIPVPNCGCVAPTGGLFIFTRDQTRDQTVIDEVRAIAVSLGYGLCDLFEVDQTDC